MISRAPLLTRIAPPVRTAANLSFVSGLPPALLYSSSPSNRPMVDVPSPRMPDRAAQSYIYQNLLGTLFTSPLPFGYQVRAPVFIRVAPAQPLAAQLPFEQGMLQSTLAVPVPTPPVGWSFEPRFVVRSPSASLEPVPVNLSNTLQSGAITNMYSTTYWGLQYERPGRPQTPEPQNFVILGFPVTAVPFVPMEFPNPTKSKPQVYYEGTFGSFRLLKGIPAGASPGIPMEFPNPTLRKVSSPQGESYGSFNLLNGYTAGASAHAPMEFPNPNRFASRPADTSNVAFALLNTTVAIPYGQSTGDSSIRRIPWTAYFEGRNALLPPIPLPTPPFTPGVVAPYGDRVILPAKKLGETVIVPIDFISKLGPSETIVSAVCMCIVYTGNDANPSAVVSGAPAITGTIVNQLTTGGVVGTIYELLCKASTSLGQTLELSGFLAVIPDLP